MSAPLQDNAAPRGFWPTWSVMIAAVVLFVVTVTGIVLVFYFVGEERERDLRDWQLRMAIVANSRVAAINDWIDQQQGRVRDLAENTSLQLYFTELEMFAGDASQVTDEPGQRTYLFNLLVAAAEAGGFTAPLRGADLDANVARLGVAGLAIVDNDGAVVVATPSMPPIDDQLTEMILASRGKRAIYDLHLGVGGEPTMGFVAPIFAVQSEGRASDQVGMIVGLKEIPDELYPLLTQPGDASATAEAMILRAGEGTVEYLSPLADGSRPFDRTLARDTPRLAASFALDRPGGFGIRRDYRNTKVLVVARGVAGVPWVVAYKIDAAEALAETNTRLRRTLTTLLLLIAAVVTAVVAAWWYGSSRRASDAARRANDLAERLADQRDFLRLVTDSQPAAMAIIDGDGHYLWANRRTADASGVAAEEVVGKTLAAVVGPVPAKALLRSVRDVLANHEIETKTRSEGDDGEPRTYRSSFIPLKPTGDLPARALVISEDVTVAFAERAKHERVMRQLIDTLVGVIDRRDPNSANHSAGVAKVARAIAEAMGLESSDADCIETAGRVMNLGKIVVPREILTKTEALTETELNLVRGSIGTSADLLEQVEFAGPVVQTLRELHEGWDGGYGVFAAPDVLLTTRVVAVANAFVALVSPRSYRAGLPVDEALDILLAKMETRDTRRVVMALANYLDNLGGRNEFADVGERPLKS